MVISLPEENYRNGIHYDYDLGSAEMWKCEIHNTINMFVIKTSLQSWPRIFLVVAHLTRALYEMTAVFAL